MRQAALVCVLAAVAFGVVGCGGGGDNGSEEPANPPAQAACDGSPLSGKEFKAAGYKVLFEELEDHDSEVSWQGEGRTGQVALRDECGGDKIYVHITNRPA